MPSLRPSINIGALLFFAAIDVAFASSPPSSIQQSISPIQNWEPSWTASAAQGTTVAITFSLASQDDEAGDDKLNPLAAALILFRSQEPFFMDSRFAKDRSSTTIELGGIKVIPVDPNQMTLANTSPRWTLLGPSALCCMTGLSSDVDYLTRRLQQQTETNTLIYDSSHSTPILRTVHSLASMLQAATQWDGDRPFGVQSLVLGGGHGRQQPLSLFTLDPGGGYRHWGMATAIGKAASQVRKCIYENLQQQQPVLESVEIALRVALNSTLTATDDNAASIQSYYQGLVVWYDHGCLRVATVRQEQLDSIRQSIIDKGDKSDGDKALI